MSAEEASKGWILHSYGQGRKFGPLSEDDLRNYFRAGMVKSVDRLTAPGEFAMIAAAEVATMLGETVPVGPPPPEVNEAPAPPPPAVATGMPRDAATEERAARAAAAMNIDISAMMASQRAEQKQRSGWLLPTVVVVGLVAMLFVGLNMLRKLKPAPSSIPASSMQTLPGSDAPDGRRDSALAASDAMAPSGARDLRRPGEAPAGGTPAGDAGIAQDPEFDARFAQAESMKNAGDWAGLASLAKTWSEAQPDRDEPLHFLGMAYSNLGNYVQAEEALKKVLSRDPQDAAVRALLADTYLQAKRFPEAAAMYKEMVTASPNDSRVWNNYGAALNGAGQQAQAAAALETAVRLDPTFKQAWSNLGNLYQSMGDSAKASAAFANAR